MKYKNVVQTKFDELESVFTFEFQLQNENPILLFYAFSNTSVERSFEVSFTINNRKQVRAKQTTLIQDSNMRTFANVSKLRVLSEGRVDKKGVEMCVFAEKGSIVKGIIKSKAVSGADDNVQILEIAQ